MTKDKKYGIAFLLGMAAIILVIYIWGRIYSHEIRKYKSICIGTITDFKEVKRPICYELSYSYIINGKEYDDVNSGTRIEPAYRKYFLGKKFPVIYSSKDPNKSDLLVFPNDFEVWGEKFPDSLNWVIPLQTYGKK